MLFSSRELARHYGFTDYDGRRPDWGRHKIDFSVLPQRGSILFRMGYRFGAPLADDARGADEEVQGKIPFLTLTAAPAAELVVIAFIVD